MAPAASSAANGHRPARLPADTTSFVGRRRELAEVRRMLSESRMVTLSGVGGVGKTRLATQTAAAVRRAFPDGVRMVELAQVEKPELLVTTVMEALEIRDHSHRPPMDVLVERLRDKHALVVLDNCEHLHDECAVLAETLLRSASKLRILATSRHVLGISGEQTLSVPPLSLSGLDPPPRAGWAPPMPEAVQLFADRARSVVPDFAVTDANRAAVEGVCRRLDGLPLAIELAAVRLRVLSVEQLLERLDDRFRLLTGGSRAVLPRHQTLRALIDWSHLLCTEQERVLWARMSVFTGGCDLEAAEEVCAGGRISRAEVVDLVSALVEKSILSREDHGGVVRYRLLESIRQYGRERLAESGESARFRRGHRDFYRWMAAEGRRRLFGPDQTAWLERLRVEHANLRAALEYCLADPAEVEVALGMGADLLYHWITSFYLTEGRDWMDRALAMDLAATEVRARALWSTSWLAIIQGDLDGAAAMLRESRAIGERLGREEILGYVALYCGMIAMFRQDAGTAIDLYKEAVERHTATGDPVGHALALIRLSLAHSFLGDSALAVSIGEQGIAVCEAHGEGWHRAYAMMALGVELWRQGDAARATSMERESLRFNRALGDPLGLGVNLEVLAWVAAGERRFTRAARLLGIAQAVWEAVGAVLSGYGHLMRYHDACVDDTRRVLGPSAFRTEFDRGAALPGEDGLAYALQETAAPDAPDRDAGRSSPLTPRETQIARLVAEGESNKRIAAALVISQRTVEGHIEHIMNKLGFNSRVQIAGWINDHDRAAGAGPDG
ncbi:non-specific serine/threonine protein kinase [Actinomadura madurae]|uniref:Non-specific serine/threonine protein kinase n=1 Tax=Actinomadura madurae TaxID=1993 RepID=A0A1I5I8Q9_9ACTN|nr:LuxR C-terminal-related transcriptional regulator [Actinomadura madurae]SFO56411.1 non-specific serine/threonine protein kinase [Actinomadura madurae]